MTNRARFDCHCGASHDVESLRRSLYIGQRTLGDLLAASRGPAPLAKRLARRQARKNVYRALGL